MAGFFELSEVTSKKPASLLPQCGACGWYKSCTSPKMPVSGKGQSGILIIGDFPSIEDDRTGDHFSVKTDTGRRLRNTLNKLGVNLHNDCWVTNSVICKPPVDKDGKPKPLKPRELEWCRPNLTQTIKDLNPRIIIPMGFHAVKQLLVPLFREDVGQMTTWAGWQIPLQKLNAWVAPVMSPRHVVESDDDKNGEVVTLLWEKQLAAAVELPGRPWEVVPDYASEVKVILDPDEAVAWLDRIIRAGKPTAFDWETNCLKPDRDDAEIVSAGFHSGGETAAFLTTGDRIKSKLAEFCASGIPKVGANNKFEDRWARRLLGTPVNNWVWDCMLSAHHLDNRKGITSVKFQAFVQLGFEPWDSVVGKYFNAPYAMALNRIHEIDTRTLLRYNGIDAVVEFKIAMKQKALMRWMNL